MSKVVERYARVQLLILDELSYVPLTPGRGRAVENERELWREYERIMALPPEQMVPEFVRVLLAPEVELLP